MTNDNTTTTWFKTMLSFPIDFKPPLTPTTHYRYLCSMYWLAVSW